MHARQHRTRGRLSRAAAVATALALPGSLLALTQAPAAAAPLPAAYSADAHGDIVDLTGDVLGLDVAGLVVGHSRSSVTSTTTDGSSTASSANLDASLVLDGVPITADGTSVTAPPSDDPPAETLADVPVDAVADVGVISGDVQAAWAGSDACVPAVDGERVLSDSLTTLAGVTLVDAPAPVGTLAEVTDSQTRTRTALVDDADGSDVVSTTTTTVGDIDLLGGAVTVDVTNPVVLEARSDGTTGSAGFVDPPTVTATVGETPVDIPLNGTPQQIDLPVLLEPLVDLSITAFTPTDESTGATGQGTLDALLRIDLEVLDAAPLLPPVADFTLDVAPMSAQATAPEGGVECGTVDDEAPDAPVIDTPADGDVTTDPTPEFSGTAEPGSTVVVEDADGNEVCTDVAEGGSWSCTPAQNLPEGEATYTATATDDAGNTSEPDTVTFEVDTATTVDVLTPADGSTIPDTTPEVSGTGEAGAAIEVTEAGLPVCSTTVEQDGTWSCTPSVPLLPGEHTFTVTAGDEVGNTDTATTTFTVDPDADDTDPPAAPVITSPADGASVQDTTPQITGTGEPGATVTVSEGSTVLCTAVVGTDTTWSCSPTVALPLGPHTVTATQTDADDNVSPADSVSFTIVAPTPAVPGDTDGDGLPDGQEGTIGTDPHDPDTDEDGLTDGAEVNTTGTDPLAPDTDDDGLTDGAEVNVHGTDPLDSDTDGDRITDGREVSGVRIKERFEACGTKVRTAILVRTDPLAKDTDKDGLADGKEVRGYTIKQRVTTKKGSFVIGGTRTDPTSKDTDRDGLKDKVEMTGRANKRFGKARTDPSTCDTDRGGVRDGVEVKARSNPADFYSGPRNPGGRSGRMPIG